MLRSARPRQAMSSRYGIPRSETFVQVTVDGVTIEASRWHSAAGSASEPVADGALVMGDLVLTESEISPVMSKLLKPHQRHRAAQPFAPRQPAYVLHARSGHGDPVAMATAIRAALAESETIWASRGTGATNRTDRPRHGRIRTTPSAPKLQWRCLSVLGSAQGRGH